MGKTSSTVKNRYNAKAYDSISVRVPKDTKEVFAEICAANGHTMNGVIGEAVKAYIEAHKSK